MVVDEAGEAVAVIFLTPKFKVITESQPLAAGIVLKYCPAVVNVVVPKE
jgi:hypothetical protein